MPALCSAADKVVQVDAIASAVVQEPRAEGRGASRRRVLKSGIAASNERRLTVSCMVRDISPSGARLRVEGSVAVPDTFELIIDTDGLEADCEVVWRKGNEVGVKFSSAPRIKTPRRPQVLTPIVPAQAPSLRRKPKPNGSGG